MTPQQFIIAAVLARIATIIASAGIALVVVLVASIKGRV